MCPRPNREYLLLIYFILDIMNRGKIYRERLSPNYINHILWDAMQYSWWDNSYIFILIRRKNQSRTHGSASSDHTN